MAYVLQSIYFLCLLLTFPTATPARSKFKAAVYEQAIVLPDVNATTTRVAALVAMEKNLAVYRQQTALAAQQNASIIVFPEDGLYGFTFTRDNIKPFLETIPDPKTVTWSACDDPVRFKDTEVTRELSCMARNNSIYVVANMGDVQPCDSASDPQCPHDGQYQYNTAVAFAPDGTLVGRYHKVNLFFEYQFDTPEDESVYFDTPFGRVGLFICFDSMFHDPAVTMVMRDNVTVIAFPTAWIDTLPLLSAIGWHSSFARGLGVNYLSANLHIPSKGAVGSGIYGPDGMVDFYYNNTDTSPGRLMVAELDVLQHRQPRLERDGEHKSNRDKARGLTREMDSNQQSCSNRHARTAASTDNDKDEFKAELFGDMFTFRALTNTSGFISVYSNHVGCHLNYSKETIGDSHDLFALGAFDGLHTKEGQYYFEICTVVRCASATNRSSCGTATRKSHTSFARLDLRGEFHVDYVYPQMLFQPSDDTLALSPAEAWTYDDRCTALTLARPSRDPVLSAVLFGRYYARDSGAYNATQIKITEQNNPHGFQISTTKHNSPAYNAGGTLVVDGRHVMGMVCTLLSMMRLI